MLSTLRLLPFALFLAISIAGCVGPLVSSQEMQLQKSEYERQTAAIVASGGATRIDHNLASITAADLDKDGYVSMIAWKGGAAAMNYYAAPGQTDTLDSPFLTWVTKNTQMTAMISKLRLQKLKSQRLALRLEQLLGLPPAGDTTRMFMEILIKPSDLFRPCRDPEVNDCACALEFPMGGYSPADQTYRPVYESVVSATAGFPWTRMGYTYDWNVKNPTHFGMSEYVIKQGAIVKIIAKTPTEAWVSGR